MSLEAIIPHMTNNSTPSPFIASASNQLATYAPFNAFQDNTGAWISDVANSSIQINLGRPHKIEKVFIDTVSSWTGAKMKTLTFQGSKDGTVWVDLYVGATTDYKYIKEKYFGIFQYLRVRAGAMTMRGGCVRYFQVYSSATGFVDLDLNNIWVTSVPTSLKGTIYATHGKMDVRVLINDTVVDDWNEFDGIVDVEYEYDSSLFNNGGNVIKVQYTGDGIDVKEETYLVYKINFEAYKFNTSSYDFKIKNSPARPSQDGWLSQHHTMAYLNSELGVSYVFRFKPFAQIDSRLEDHPRLFDRILKENFDDESKKIFADRRKENSIAIKSEGVISDITRVFDTIKSPGFVSAFKDLGVIQRVFDSWASINTETIGIKPDIKNSAEKKIKIAKDILAVHSLNARRKDAIQNALTMIQGYELATKQTFDTVVAYYRAMEDFYPFKETILGGLLINAMSKDNIAVLYHNINSGTKDVSVVHSYADLIFGGADDNHAYVDEYVDADRIYIADSSIYDLLIAKRKEHDNIHVPNAADSFGVKEEMYGTSNDQSFGMTGTETGTTYDLLLGYKEQSKDTHNIEVVFVKKNVDTKVGHTLESVLLDKNQKTKEFEIDGIKFVNKLSIDALVEELREYIDSMPLDALDKPMLTFIDKMSGDSHIIQVQTEVSIMEVDAWLIKSPDEFLDIQDVDALIYPEATQYIDKMGKDGRIIEVDHVISKQNIDSWILTDATYKVDKLSKDMRIDESVMFVLKTNGKDAMPINISYFFEKGGRDIASLITSSFTDKTSKNANDLGTGINYVDKVLQQVFNKDIIKSLDKINKQALLITLLTNIDSVDKASIIHTNWEFAIKLIEQAKVIDDAVRYSDKDERYSHLYDDSLAYIDDKKAIIIDALLLDHVNLNGYIMELVGDSERDDNRLTVKLDDTLSIKEVSTGIIEEMILTNRKNQEKAGYIPANTFVLAGNGSDWEEIWDRYSPGVDILDPPDSDYDYSKLAPAIYDVKTGVPKNPIGPSNKSDVYVRNALSHPIPDNNTVGVDDTKRIAVDNYIFIDTVLALESIKNRNILRYAGMPVGKAIKEVFSQLYTWIQQAAPGHPEYERMFRFARWYAEAVVLRNSKQVLHRVYNPWQSSLHLGSGLGIDHTKHGWLYMTGTGTLDTTSLSGRLIFSKENYIDSEFVLRGYFDNPASQGTMEISVDGVVVDSFSSHGVYERRIEIPQGHHNYDIFFHGASGTAVISSIEIGGTTFVSAHTTSDDSDVNGLKALTELMAQLLGYFELHHGGRKIKGTMEVRQRAVWNTHT